MNTFNDIKELVTALKKEEKLISEIGQFLAINLWVLAVGYWRLANSQQLVLSAHS